MYFVELEGLKEGRKFRRIDWYPTCYLYWDEKENVFKDESKETHNYLNEKSESINYSDWEYYQEPKKKKKIKLYAYAGYDSIIDMEHLWEIYYSASDKLGDEYYFRVPEFDKEIEMEA